MRGNTDNFNEEMKSPGDALPNGNPAGLDQSSDENTSITLIRTGYNREAFNNTFNTDFTELGVNEQDLSFFDPNLATVEDFFTIYNNLFFIIPKRGEINSHEFLIKESSDYIDYKANQLEIEALLEEIAELRESNLQLQVDMAGILGAKKEIDKAIEQGRTAAGS
tara:strand:- start:1757 stop:2251 length:495 start_codon:yes stop_codon:yes gene_type:complete